MGLSDKLRGPMDSVASMLSSIANSSGNTSFSDESRLNQLKILYLFTFADGKSLPVEQQYVRQFVGEETIKESVKNDFEAYCKEIDSDPPSTYLATKKRIDKLLGDRSENASTFSWARERNIDYNKRLQAQTIWTLINLGNCDGEYTDDEKDVVEHLTVRWEMDPILVDELNDSVAAILALTKHKEYLLTTEDLNGQGTEMIESLNQSMEVIVDNIRIAIDEADLGRGKQ